MIPELSKVDFLLRAGDFGGLQRLAETASPATWSRLVDRMELYTTELKAQQQEAVRAWSEAEAETRRFQRLLEALPVPVVVVDHVGRILDANAAAGHLLGGRPNIVGTYLFEEASDTHRALLQRLVVNASDTVQSAEITLRAAGAKRNITLHVVDNTPVGGRGQQVLCVLEDRSKDGHGLADLALEVQQDTLTGLYSRDAFDQFVERLVAQDERQTGLIIIDVDRFKWVNDNHGHAVGDRTLVAVSRVLETRVRPSDLVARVGGDVFAVAMPNVIDTRMVHRAAQGIVDALKDGVSVGGAHIAVSISAGVALSRAGEDGESLNERATAAMQRAKEGGRATWHPFDASLEAEVARFRATRDSIMAALEEDRLRLCAHPIVQLDGGAVVGHELQLQLEDAQGDLIPLGAFLDVAKASGALADIAGWARREALGLLAMGSATLGDGFIALDASPELDDAFADDLLELLRSFDIPGDRVMVRVTEAATLPGGTKGARVLERLATAGIALALDGFGTGYASLVHVASLPLTWVKWDRMLVETHAGTGENVLEAIVHLSQALGLEVIAEGIDNAEQQALLRRLGCSCGTGTHLGAPVLLDRIQGPGRPGRRGLRPAKRPEPTPQGA